MQKEYRENMWDITPHQGQNSRSKQDQRAETTHIVQEVPVVLKVVDSISGLSEVGMKPESLWHQLDVITPIPPD